MSKSLNKAQNQISLSLSSNLERKKILKENVRLAKFSFRCLGSLKGEKSEEISANKGERNTVSENNGQQKNIISKELPVSSKALGSTRSNLSEEDIERRTRIEDELKDSSTFIDYLAPRPLRRIYFASGAASCTVAFIVSLSKVIANPSLELAEGGITNVGINLAGAIVFGALFLWEGKQKEKRIIERKEIREAQIRLGDREVFVSTSGETMSRLKPVDDDWIIRRLDRWGKKDLLPQVGPKKGAILQGLVQKKQPKLIVEVGSFTGYSAIKLAQAMPNGSSVISFEIDFKWLMVAKRFVWQAKMADKVDIRWGDGIKALPNVNAPIDFLFLDAKPWEYLDYLKAAEALLSPGAIVVADNAGVFDRSLAPYLDYVRTSPKYRSEFIESTLEYRDEVADGLEVSVYLGP